MPAKVQQHDSTLDRRLQGLVGFGQGILGLAGVIGPIVAAAIVGGAILGRLWLIHRKQRRHLPVAAFGGKQVLAQHGDTVPGPALDAFVRGAVNGFAPMET